MSVLRTISPDAGEMGMNEMVARQIRDIVEQTDAADSKWENPCIGKHPVILRRHGERSAIFQFWDYTRSFQMRDRHRVKSEDVCTWFTFVRYDPNQLEVLVSGVMLHVPRFEAHSRTSILEYALQKMNRAIRIAFQSTFSELYRNNRLLARSILMADVMFKKPVGLVRCPCIDKLTRTNCQLVCNYEITAEDMIQFGLVTMEGRRSRRATIRCGRLTGFNKYYLRMIDDYLTLSRAKIKWDEKYSFMPVKGPMDERRYSRVRWRQIQTVTCSSSQDSVPSA